MPPLREVVREVRSWPLAVPLLAAACVLLLVSCLTGCNPTPAPRPVNPVLRERAAYEAYVKQITVYSLSPADMGKSCAFAWPRAPFKSVYLSTSPACYPNFNTGLYDPVMYAATLRHEWAHEVAFTTGFGYPCAGGQNCVYLFESHADAIVQALGYPFPLGWNILNPAVNGYGPQPAPLVAAAHQALQRLAAIMLPPIPPTR